MGWSGKGITSAMEAARVTSSMTARASASSTSISVFTTYARDSASCSLWMSIALSANALWTKL